MNDKSSSMLVKPLPRSRYHLNVTMTLTSTDGDVYLRPVKVAQRGEEGGKQHYYVAVQMIVAGALLY